MQGYRCGWKLKCNLEVIYPKDEQKGLFSQCFGQESCSQCLYSHFGGTPLIISITEACTHGKINDISRHVE